jgi:hypothetical protein
MKAHGKASNPQRRVQTAGVTGVSERLNADDLRIGADVGNLRGERVGHRDEGYVRLFAQIW